MLYASILIALPALQFATAGPTETEWYYETYPGSWEYVTYNVPEKKCSAPAVQAPFNNKAISFHEKKDPATFDSNPGSDHGITAKSVIKAGLKPGKIVRVNGFAYQFAYWGRGKNDNWIEKGQQVKVTTVPGANRLGFLLASNMGNFGGKFEIVYTDCSSKSADVGATDWKWTVARAPGNTVALRDLVASPNKLEVRLYSTEVPIDAGKEIAYVKFPTAVYPIRPYKKGHNGHVHVFAIATKKAPH
ncbi:hypothetical protein K493DRAFT_299532 [Basidiobolus meristosporus CBS 931.73]|uniref:Uncharacterized protein n=1 Tax=Basidiobolus meristosporus CBS 931.73 TaxID=1314790 RepID=A0A1Y1YMV9_9FUNG|nr:hypothetical protein K493DRAFT_299532 [Basidiobolus meristosporus CBS 931.73]|eukprot:ORX99193.1 hypothetical protein K493DRAFT_299532 [Basidiobolus meristosporus CBS 931.73]